MPGEPEARLTLPEPVLPVQALLVPRAAREAQQAVPGEQEAALGELQELQELQQQAAERAARVPVWQALRAQQVRQEQVQRPPEPRSR